MSYVVRSSSSRRGICVPIGTRQIPANHSLNPPRIRFDPTDIVIAFSSSLGRFASHPLVLGSLAVRNCMVCLSLREAESLEGTFILADCCVGGVSVAVG